VDSPPIKLHSIARSGGRGPPSGQGAGQQWHDEIGRALARCNSFILILSPDSIKLEWLKRELLFALREPRYVGRIVPVLYRKCNPTKLSWTLPAVQIVDFVKGINAGYAELLRVFRLTPRPPT